MIRRCWSAPTRACSSITGDRRSSGPAIRISSSRARCPTSARGALQVFLTDRTVPFKAAGEQLLGESLERVEQTDLPNRP